MNVDYEPTATADLDRAAEEIAADYGGHVANLFLTRVEMTTNQVAGHSRSPSSIRPRRLTLACAWCP